MKKNSGICYVLLVASLALTLVFSCSTGSSGSDDKPDTFTITILQNGVTNGDVVTANVAKAAKDATITLTASLGAGHCVVLSADGIAINPATISVNDGTATFTMPGKAVVVTATFSDIPPTVYAITVIPTGATGTESVSASVTEAAEGAPVTLTASLGAGRRVALSAAGVTMTPSTISANGDTATFTMPATAVAVTATFSDIPPTLYAVTVAPTGAQSGESVSANVAEAREGTSITLTASLNAGRRVALSADGIVITPETISTDDGTATFTMPGNAVAVTVTFYSVYTITVTPNGATGSEGVTANVNEAAEGTAVTLTASLGASRQVAQSVDGVIIDPSTINTDSGTATFTMPGNAVEITATFSDILYPITITPTGVTGSEEVTASVTTAVQGTTITLTASLGTSRRVTLSAGGVVIDPSTIYTDRDTATFTMPANAVDIRACFFTATTQSAGSVDFNMHYVPSGSFTMGEDVISPTQTVTLTKDFWMGETEVTQGLLEAVWGSWPVGPPNGTGGVGDNKPAYYVNWYEAVAFCNKLTISDDSIADSEQVYYSDAGLTSPYTSGTTVYADLTKKGYRLPTEAEWEYAARYIDGTRWNGGDHVCGGPVYTDETDPDKVGDYAWYSGNNSPSGSKVVGQKTANALGLRDMSGNVAEWCYDWYTVFSGVSISDPTGPTSGSYRECRGGFWIGGINPCSSRSKVDPTNRSIIIGFRLCRTAD